MSIISGFFAKSVSPIIKEEINKVMLSLKRLGGGQFDIPSPVVFQKMYLLRRG